MTIDTNTMISITEANQNFSKVANSEDVFAISERLMKQNMEASVFVMKECWTWH